ncbi:hypothetical protein QR680_005559 [Steinernema hermaphroditum]|uniref:F-box domain-containing protein n=1 Tax=Steinernema hermaphroditum TaxID=289476 RepID=A0AA39HSH3_9BILA|nr:hypothetical protein QR680_005559 [Steinernema hermaphroditum]
MERSRRRVDPQPSSSEAVAPEASLGRLPDELLERIGDHLDFEDLHSFMRSSPFVNLALVRSLRNFHALQISDESSSCFVENRRSKLRKSFRRSSLPLLYSMIPDIDEIVIIVKDMITPNVQEPLDRPSTSDPLLNASLYHPGGYLGRILAVTPATTIAKLRSLSLHVDLMRETFKELLFFYCPAEDVCFAAQHLSAQPFDTNIQISYCCGNYDASDEEMRSHLIYTMQMLSKYMADAHDCKTDMVYERDEGYVDLTVQKGRLEHNFAFFYYNPSICEPIRARGASEASEDSEEEEEEVMETDESLDSGIENELRPADFLEWPCPKQFAASRLLSPATADR